MDALDRAASFMEELLDFASDIGEEEEADDDTSEKTKNSLSSSSSLSLLPPKALPVSLLPQYLSSAISAVTRSTPPSHPASSGSN